MYKYASELRADELGIRLGKTITITKWNICIDWEVALDLSELFRGKIFVLFCWLGLVFITLCLLFFFFFFFSTRSGQLGFASVPDFQNPPFGVCTRVYHFLTMWYNTGGQQLPSTFFLEWGYHSRRSPIQVLTVPMLLHFCTRNRGNRCFNIVRQLALEFGLLCMVRQPSANTHVIWVARHKVTRPQTIFKFRPPSRLDYRTRHGSQSTIFV
jgi:hypothetical protein